MKRLITANRIRIIEESGDAVQLRASVTALWNSDKTQRVLIVKDRHLSLAVKLMKEHGACGTVRNINGSKRVEVDPPPMEQVFQLSTYGR